MAPTEKSTYFGYSDGHDPTLLCLGTMTFDYANPRTKRPYFHPHVKELLEDPPMATADERLFCAMSHVSDGSYKLGAGIEGLLDFENSQSNATYRLVVGRNGSKIELIRPDEFFEEMVLSNDKARLWIQTRLSVANKFHTLYKNIVAAPKIWLLTGIYVIEDAVTYNVISKSSTNAASVTVPIPEPTGLAALLGVAVGARFKFGRGFEGQASAQILGARIWAAQWQQIDARSNVDEIKLAEVKLEATYATLDHNLLDNHVVSAKAEYDDEKWCRFEEEVDDLLEELEEQQSY